MKEIVISSIGLGLIGFLFAVILSIADKKLAVKKDPVLEKILKILPGVNCGACGFSSCEAFAQNILEKKSLFKGCLAGGKEVNEKLCNLLGLESPHTTKKKVIVKCSQTEPKRFSAEYRGVKSCALADLTQTDLACKYGCLGFGDCEKVCKFGAIKIEKGLPVINYEKCVGCGECVKACPRNVLEIVEIKNDKLYWVGCNNPETAMQVKKVCDVGCIGCGLCTKVIPESPFYLEEALAKICYKKIEDKNLDLALQKCPTKVIKKIDVS